MKPSIQVRSDLNPQFVRIEAPITARKLAKINNSLGRVQFDNRLTPRDHLKLAGRLRRYPNIYLRAFELFGSPEQNLDFLQYYKGLKRLTVNLRNLQSVVGVRHVADSLEYFNFGETKDKISLEFLGQLTRLKGLYLDGHVLGIETISRLRQLEEVTLRSITLPGLEIIAKLPKLWALDIALGGTRNLAALSRLKSLKYLGLWMIRGLSDISVISQITSLQEIALESLQNVTAVSALHKLRKLRRVALKHMKGIRDLSPLLAAKALEDVIISRASHLMPQAFLPLQKHSSLKAIGFGLGSDKKNRAVAAMFPQLQHTINYPFIFR